MKTLILEKEQIFLDQKLDTKDKVLLFIAKKAKELGVTTNETELYEKLWDREKEYSTAVQELIAIPHVKSNLLNSVKVLFIRLTEPIDWDSPENFKVKAIFSILVPESDAEQKHLEILSKIAVSLLEDDFQDAILNVKTNDELIEYVEKYLNGGL